MVVTKRGRFVTLFRAIFFEHDLVRTVSILTTFNSLLLFIIKSAKYGPAWRSNVGVEDILLLPFRGGLWLGFSIINCLIFAAALEPFPANEVPKYFRGHRFLYTVFLGLTATWIVGAAVVIAYAARLISHDEFVWMCMTLVLLSAFSAVSPIIYEAGKSQNQFILAAALILVISNIVFALLPPNSRERIIVTFENADTKPATLITTVHSGVIVKGPQKHSIFYPWDKVRQVDYPRVPAR